jgi:hypothetical protein
MPGNHLQMSRIVVARRQASSPSARLCKPEVTGSIPVRSIGRKGFGQAAFTTLGLGFAARHRGPNMG